MALSVEIDPALVAPTSPMVECSDSPLATGGTGDFCDYPMPIRMETFDTLVLMGRVSEPAGWAPLIEVAEQTDGNLRGRFCTYRYVDVSPASCPMQEPVCSTGGTIRITSWPPTAPLSFELAADFDGGAQVAIAQGIDQ